MIPKFKEPIVFCDVDDTLVSWKHYGEFNRSIDCIAFEDPATGGHLYLEPIYEHVEALKGHKLRGHTVIVWSAGGADWAETVVKTLGLTKYVDAVMSKPDWFYDDIPSSEFMPESNRKFYKKGNLGENE